MENVKGSYFSIKQFALDEWNTFAGDLFTVTKITTIDSKIVDSAILASDTMDWNQIFKAFFPSDISDRKFLGKYNFNQFDDNVDGTHNFFYEAKDEDQFTQKLLITIALFTNKVKGIYIETRKSSISGDITQKLYYKPMTEVQIQTIDEPKMGNKKHTVVQYDFNR